MLPDLETTRGGQTNHPFFFPIEELSSFCRSFFGRGRLRSTVNKLVAFQTRRGLFSPCVPREVRPFWRRRRERRVPVIFLPSLDKRYQKPHACWLALFSSSPHIPCKQSFFPGTCTTNSNMHVVFQMKTSRDKNTRVAQKARRSRPVFILTEVTDNRRFLLLLLLFSKDTAG